VVWVKVQDPTVFDKANIRAITNENVWGTVKIKFGARDIFPNAKDPPCNFFQNNDQQAFDVTSVSCYSTSFGRLPGQADTVQCPVQTK